MHCNLTFIVYLLLFILASAWELSSIFSSWDSTSESNKDPLPIEDTLIMMGDTSKVRKRIENTIVDK